MGLTNNTAPSNSGSIGGSSLTDTALGIYGPSYKLAEKKEKDVEEGISRMEAEPKATPPKMEDAPKPENYHTDPMQTFGSAASFLAMFGSLLTKQPLTNALNSGAAVMNAKNAQDANAFKQAMDKWKLDTDNAWKMANWQQDVYKEALSKDEAELKMRAASFKDEVMLHMADAKMAQQAIRDRDKQLKKAQGATGHILDYAQAAYDKVIKEGGSEETANHAYMKAYGDATNITKGKDDTAESLPDISKLKGTDIYPGTSMTVDAVKSKAEQSLVDPTVLSRGGLPMKDKNAVMNYAAELQKNKGLSGTDVASTQAGVKADTHSLMNMQKMTDSAESFEDTAKLNFDNALKLAKEGGIPSDMGPWWNKYVQSGETALGDPNIPPFAAALITAANEYAKVMSGATGAQGATDSSRAEAASLFNTAYDYKTLKNVVEKVAYVDMENRKESLERRISTIKDRIKNSGQNEKKDDNKKLIDKYGLQP